MKALTPRSVLTVLSLLIAAISAEAQSLDRPNDSGRSDRKQNAPNLGSFQFQTILPQPDASVSDTGTPGTNGTDGNPGTVGGNGGAANANASSVDACNDATATGGNGGNGGNGDV